MAIKITLTVFLGFAGISRAQCLLGKPAANLPEGISLVIRADKTTAKLAESVIIGVELSNGSKTEIAIWDRFVERDYELHVLDVHGLEAPLTEWGKRIRTPPLRDWRRMLLKLAPGEKIRDEEKLLKVYDISEVGFYTIQACRDLIGYGNIYSNKVQVEIQ